MKGTGFNKDGALLILTGLVCAGLAWALFRYSDESVWTAMLAIVIAVLILDNRRLRKKVKSLS